jgi:hypothetical protein
MITKDKLKDICKTFKLPVSGNKEEVQKRLCNFICNNIEEAKTLNKLLKIKDNIKLLSIINDILEMVDDDSTIKAISKYVMKTYNIKINNKDMYTFIEIMDAFIKKDFMYIEENLNNFSKIGIELVKVYATEKHEVKLLDALNI